MSIPRLGYIVQLDLPGYPVKIGYTKNPWTRLDTFSQNTPVACRMIGLTLDGIEREKEMLAATARTKIKGEWRYITGELRALVSSYHANREWFTFQRGAFDPEDIRERALALAPECEQYLTRDLTPRSVGYYWANVVLSRAATRDPLLAIHWAGFRESPEPPAFDWPQQLARVA